jgi:hypothetical protein
MYESFTNWGTPGNAAAGLAEELLAAGGALTEDPVVPHPARANSNPTANVTTKIFFIFFTPS